MINFRICKNELESLVVPAGMNKDNQVLITFNRKNTNWYIIACDCIGRLVNGKVSEISHSRSLNGVLVDIYKETDPADLENIADKCKAKLSSIEKALRVSLGPLKIMGGDYSFNFKNLYSEKNIPELMVQSYYDAAWSLLSGIKDNSLLTDELKMKTIIPTVFMLRHAIELAFKVILFKMGQKSEDVEHNLIAAWEIIKAKLIEKKLQDVEYKDKVNHVLELLKVWNLDVNEELFRYSKNKNESVLYDSNPFNLFGLCERLGEVIGDSMDRIRAIDEEVYAKTIT